MSVYHLGSLQLRDIIVGNKKYEIFPLSSGVRLGDKIVYHDGYIYSRGKDDPRIAKVTAVVIDITYYENFEQAVRKSKVKYVAPFHYTYNNCREIYISEYGEEFVDNHLPAIAARIVVNEEENVHTIETCSEDIFARIAGGRLKSDTVLMDKVPDECSIRPGDYIEYTYAGDAVYTIINTVFTYDNVRDIVSIRYERELNPVELSNIKFCDLICCNNNYIGVTYNKEKWISSKISYGNSIYLVLFDLV